MSESNLEAGIKVIEIFKNSPRSRNGKKSDLLDTGYHRNPNNWISRETRQTHYTIEYRLDETATHVHVLRCTVSALPAADTRNLQNDRQAM